MNGATTLPNKIEKIRDCRTISKSFITTLNGLLALVLTALAGTIDSTDVQANELLRNLSISFGATITGLQLLLVFGIDVLVAKNTNGQEEEKSVRDLLESDTLGGKIQKGNEMIGKIIVEIKKVRDQMNDSDKAKFSHQIEQLEAAYGPLGTGMNSV